MSIRLLCSLLRASCLRSERKGRVDVVLLGTTLDHVSYALLGLRQELWRRVVAKKVGELFSQEEVSPRLQ